MDRTKPSRGDHPYNNRLYHVILTTLLLIVPTLAPLSSAEEVDATSSSSSSAIKINHDATGDHLDDVLRKYVDQVLSVDEFSIMPGVEVERLASNSTPGRNYTSEGSRKSRSHKTELGPSRLEDYVEERLLEYSDTHVLAVNIPATARFFSGGGGSAGKSSFLTGFGMGFLAFGLKKLLLPLFIGAQLVKSVLIAMFLPSILGSVGKILGKGLSTFSGISGASTGINNNHQTADQIDDFEFKDTSPYNNNEAQGEDSMLSLNVATSSTEGPLKKANSRFGLGNQRISYHSPHNQINDNYYLRKPAKKTDYKVFHKIPSSSLLLTTYDPFYSPLLSRLDAVFQQLGLGNEKSPETERCRERLVCQMYANPAKYAPYSNLVSAQLSRELNELRKPSSDNPEILRFFRYMKAAKDGQDGDECLEHGGCPLTTNQASPAILTTYNDINKLVQARKLT